MIALPRYEKSSYARFDFQAPDGLGHWVYPDWDDPSLKVEFYDYLGTLRATATVGGSPALTQDNDYDETNNPDGGPYVRIENIDLADFALGPVEARVYAKVDGLEVAPYPTILTAFEVVSDLQEGPLYTTVERVKLEIPGAWPEEVTDEMILLAISDASRKIDAFLKTVYATPFNDVADEDPTPPAVEIIARKLAAHQCMVWMGRVNAIADENLKERAISELEKMVPQDGRPPLVRLEGYAGPRAVYQGGIARNEME